MPDLPQYQLALVAVLAALLYAVPTLIAVVRTHHSRHAIFALNILLGWTFFGWAAALIWSLTAVNRALQGVDGKGGKLFHLAYFIPVIVFGVIAGYFLWGLDPDRDPREIPSVMIDQPVPEFELAPIEGMEGPGLAAADLRNGRGNPEVSPECGREVALIVEATTHRNFGDWPRRRCKCFGGSHESTAP